MKLKFISLPTHTVRALQAGCPDANGQHPEKQTSGGMGECRHCLRMIPEGEDMLVLAYRPFTTVQPYAEVGPIFLCAKTCPPHAESHDLPTMFEDWEHVLVRGYDENEHIVYGSGQIVKKSDMTSIISTAFKTQENIAFFHVRSAGNNCYECRVERG